MSVQFCTLKPQSRKFTLYSTGNYNISTNLVTSCWLNALAARTHCSLSWLHFAMFCYIFGFCDIQQGYSEFYSGLVDSVGSELKGSKDFTKLCAGLSILGYISSQSDGTSTKAFSQLLTFLGHRYPKVTFTFACLKRITLRNNQF